MHYTGANSHPDPADSDDPRTAASPIEDSPPHESGRLVRGATQTVSLEDET